MNKKKLDKTSLIMIIVFALLIVGAAAGFLYASLTSEDDGENGETLQTENEVAEENETAGYETYEALANTFIEICKAGDTEAMYGLYYDNLLDVRCSESGVTKEEYDGVMRDNMVRIVGFDEYMYGGSEMLETQSPAGYVNELYYRANGTAFPYTDVNITNCADLRAYFENGAFFDFMLAKIDGLWYVVV